MIYIGSPRWSHPKQVRLGITNSEEYARNSNCMEGSTTLCALPKSEVVLRWHKQTTGDFHFCSKSPVTISYQAVSRHYDDLMTEFLIRASPLASCTG